MQCSWAAAGHPPPSFVLEPQLNDIYCQFGKRLGWMLDNGVKRVWVGGKRGGRNETLTENVFSYFSCTISDLAGRRRGRVCVAFASYKFVCTGMCFTFAYLFIDQVQVPGSRSRAIPFQFSFAARDDQEYCNGWQIYFVCRRRRRFFFSSSTDPAWSACRPSFPSFPSFSGPSAFVLFIFAMCRALPCILKCSKNAPRNTHPCVADRPFTVAYSLLKSFSATHNKNDKQMF